MTSIFLFLFLRHTTLSRYNSVVYFAAATAAADILFYSFCYFSSYGRVHINFLPDSSTLYTSSDLSQGSVKKCKLHGRRSQHTSLAQRQCIYNLYLFDCLICTFCFRQGHPKIRTTHLYGSAAYVIH